MKDFGIKFNGGKNNVLADDSNEKYIHEIDFAPLDLDIFQACDDS
jgi:hypothetical protein